MTANWYEIILFILGAYVLGSVRFGLVAAWVRGIDIRKTGSGNIGATNVARALGSGWGVAVFTLDMLKGFAPTMLAITRLAGPMAGSSGGYSFPDQMVIASVAAAVLLGHVYPVYPGSRGGKGAATGLGLLLALNLSAGVSAFGMWVLVLGIWGYVSLASMVASASYPALWFIVGLISGRGIQLGWLTWAFTAVLCMLVVLRHRPNVSRMISGTEPKIGERVGAAEPERRE